MNQRTQFCSLRTLQKKAHTQSIKIVKNYFFETILILQLREYFILHDFQNAWEYFLNRICKLSQLLKDFMVAYLKIHFSFLQILRFGDCFKQYWYCLNSSRCFLTFVHSKIQSQRKLSKWQSTAERLEDLKNYLNNALKDTPQMTALCSVMLVLF